jgi:hypothetical protein
MFPIQPKHVRYIKLGVGGRWEKIALERGELHLGHRRVPHELCCKGDWNGVLQHLIGSGKPPGTARSLTRELQDFYTLGPDCLWVTIAMRKLWWGFAAPEVTWVGGEGKHSGLRTRRLVGGWRHVDGRGEVLSIDHLSTSITKVAAYRQTLCEIDAAAALVRRINGVEEPIIARALAAQEEMREAAEEMIAQLHWADFETLVDLIFARSGWERISRIGGTQKDVDLVVRERVTEETAWVQVKSKTDQRTLDKYVASFAKTPQGKRLFFVTHTVDGSPLMSNNDAISVWTANRLSTLIIQCGLYSWLLEKARASSGAKNP